MGLNQPRVAFERIEPNPPDAGSLARRRAADRHAIQRPGQIPGVIACQTAFKRDPRSASKRDPLFG